MHVLIERLSQNLERVEAWLAAHEKAEELPIYTSVDIRDAGFKAAVVDTNLYPAGFNNLSEAGIHASATAMRTAILNRVQGCKSVLIIAEEHTRNTWYLEHLRVLQMIIEQAGFSARVATFLTAQPDACQDSKYVELETATGQSLKIYCLKQLMQKLADRNAQPCFVIMNNDLSGGIPDILKQITTPIYPSIQAGWHARLKSRHFQHTAELVNEFAQILSLDPWLFSCQYTVVDKVDVHQAADRERVAVEVALMLEAIQAKYTEHGIREKPFVFLKADSGTYGMGVMPIESPEQIKDLNRKARNKLHVGKGSQVITRYLLQEGVASSHALESGPAEVCLYQIENTFVGGFFRSHPDKSSRENLNSKGMNFTTISPDLELHFGPSVGGICLFDLYRILGRIAAVAAHREIIQLETVVN